MSFYKNIKTENIKLKLTFLKDDGVEIFMKREDLIHPIISGNKFRKLKYNIEKFKKNKNSTLITFGGAYSNHLLAVSYIAKIENITLKTKAPTTPQRIICFLFFGTKFAAINPMMTALSAVKIKVIKILYVKMISS